MQQPAPYEKIGGEESVQTLVDRFYDLMNEDDSVREINARLFLVPLF